MRKPSLPRGVIGLMFLILVGLPAGIGWAGRTLTLDRVFPNQFPVRIAAIVFGEDSRIDSEASLGFGEWAVRYGPEHPMAYYRCEEPCTGNDPPPVVLIQGLVCDTPMVEGADCDLAVTLDRRGPPECEFIIDESSTGRNSIDCPLELETR